MKLNMAFKAGLLILLGSFAFNGQLLAISTPENIQVEVPQRININNADLATLSSLKGIGHTKALAIVAYRDNMGNFTSIDELLNVKGIGEKVLSSIKDKITI